MNIFFLRKKVFFHSVIFVLFIFSILYRFKIQLRNDFFFNMRRLIFFSLFFVLLFPTFLNLTKNIIQLKIKHIYDKNLIITYYTTYTLWLKLYFFEKKRFFFTFEKSLNYKQKHLLREQILLLNLKVKQQKCFGFVITF